MTAPPPLAPLEADLGSLVGDVLRGWRRVAAGVVAGVITAIAIIVFVPARFDAHALVVVRTPQTSAGAIAGKLGPLAQFAGAGAAGVLTNDLDTELALLKSRAIAGVVVDSLRLQVRALDPARIASLDLVDSVQLPNRFAPVTVTLTPGPNTLSQGKVWLNRNAPVLRARLLDREDAVEWVGENFDARKQGGDVVRVTFTSYDSITAASVPNLAIANYLLRRKTVDRGLNQRRLEFLVAKQDSVDRALSAAATALRDAQDAGGIAALEPTTKSALEQLVASESYLSALRAEQGALDSMLAEKSADPRRFAAFPSLLKSPAVNEIVSQLSYLETQRATLEATYAPTSAPVRAVISARDSLMAQLLPLARTYTQSLARQRAAFEQDLERTRQRVRQLPGAGLKVFIADAALRRLATVDVAMGAQVLESRLAAITEGGDVRVVDAAVAPRKVSFPRPVLTVAIAALAGLLVGVASILIVPPRAPVA